MDLTIEEQNQQDAQVLLQETVPDEASNSCYLNHENKFKHWVANHPRLAEFNIPVPGPPDKHVSAASVGKYFVEVQGTRCVARGTMDKVVYAINKLAAREGSDVAPDIRQGTCGETVRNILEAVANKKEDQVQTNAAIKDPHDDNPLNVLSQQQVSKVMLTRLQNGNNWADLVTVWAITTVTLLRFDSACQLTLNKLYLCEDKPPHGIKTPHDHEQWEDPHEKVDGRLLAFLIPGTDQKKKNMKHQLRQMEVVGCYRHKRVELSSWNNQFRIFNTLPQHVGQNIFHEP